MKLLKNLLLGWVVGTLSIVVLCAFITGVGVLGGLFVYTGYMAIRTRTEMWYIRMTL